MATTSTSLSRRWQEQFHSLEAECPWPGPKPLGTDDPELLVGREEDLTRFRQEVDGHRLILLSGESGVGKSSLLDAGLVRELRGSGYQVIVCREWNGQMGTTFLAEKVAASMANDPAVEVPDGLRAGNELFDDLEKTWGEGVVLILDQFEELIRYHEAHADHLYDLLLNLNATSEIKLVISLRSEYLPRLRRLENGARPYSISRYVLEPILAEYAEKVINVEKSIGMIDSDVATAIAERWQAANETGTIGDTNDPGVRIGLLHLQALLYALFHSSDSGRVTADTLMRFEQTCDSGLFAGALTRSIEVKLERCRATCEALGLDRYLIEGTAESVARTVRNLSSGGYKLVREAGDLAENALEDLDTLTSRLASAGGDDGDGPLAAEQFASLFQGIIEAIPRGDDTPIIDLLDGSRVAFAEQADSSAPVQGATSWVTRLHPGTLPSVADPGEVSSGAMFGMAPAAVLIEELRRFAFGLLWLVESAIVRLSSPGEVGTMVSLIHDGFGRAVETWSSQTVGRPKAALHDLTAPSGASFPWQFDDEVVGGLDHLLVVPNLRWKGAWVRADFEDVIFVNCDLRGTFFDSCHFRATTFVNCLLDGVIFSDCEIHGSEPLVSQEWDKEVDEPEFAVDPRDPRLLTDIAHYLGDAAEDEPNCLHSPLPGRPARPARRSEVDATLWTPASAGLVVYGGRVSSLVFRNCRFDDGRISLRRVAGSGFDLVEQSGGKLEIFGSVLRHLTVTTAVSTELGDPFELDAVGSLLAQLWFGENLQGRGGFSDCRLVQVWNGSESLELEASGGSSYYGLVNVAVTDASAMVEGDAVRAVTEVDPPQAGGTLGRVRQGAKAMDYRRNPAFLSTQRERG